MSNKLASRCFNYFKHYKFKELSLRKIKYTLLIMIIIISNTYFENNNIISAGITVPEKVRIGLYFETTALSSFTISAERGLKIGSSNNNTFTPIYEEPSNGIVTVRKDSYFYLKSNKLTEFKITDKNIPEGEKFGPVHIQIGSSYPDQAAAKEALTAIKSLGVAAYLAFVDNWQIWYGFYTDQNAAQADLDSVLKQKLQGYAFTPILPASNRIVVSNPTGETAFIMGSDTNTFKICPNQENNPYIFKINNSDSLRYRGELEVKRITGSDMTLINVLSPEHYLYGVVPAEIGSSSDPEALKAQAVAARTYLIGNLNKHKKQFFDLCTTTSCQVYKGFAGEYASTNKAIDDTAGKKLTYQGKIAEVFYFSSCGGRTEDVKNVWGSDIPYLRSVEDKYESGKSYNYNWETTLTASKIKEIMIGRGYNLGDITGVNITKTSEAGRVTELVISGTKGQRVYKLDGCRTVFGFNSQWYTIVSDAVVPMKKVDNTVVQTQLATKKVMTAGGLKDLAVKNGQITVIGAEGVKNTVSAAPQSYKFVGKGWGHAVGMSQTGAMGMAKAGFKYDQILTHYFQGTVIE
ncbi:SpoIID/LytB domain-containing protein [Pseudobacteroides cellulosolvens]|uniref:SpoIID/LytB domain protein n=1 Tax=Pseudobacteroides cellulosolvens ATCC 35603 = DSM 2933 TaxID=398512 RepID=A0A0L6JI75_9FIRM|nr:SpoIID/LytB domain-containing protein [Pseudobacteroides cellulosolvens]KNY25439.1 SpoIID/LytB domain protein [Pseudobacteroides cellulosolvens ATCC 35603 = DSM 2933]